MIDKALFLVYNIIVVMSEDVTGYMQTYRSGHNGADSKSVCGQPHVGSNPTRCAIEATASYRRSLFYSADTFLRWNIPPIAAADCSWAEKSRWA